MNLLEATIMSKSLLPNIVTIAGVLVFVGALAAAPVSLPPPPGEGELPHLSGLLWGRVGEQRRLHQQAVTVSLSGRPSADSPRTAIVLSWTLARNPMDLASFLSPAIKSLMPVLDSGPDGSAMMRRIRESPSPMIWWLEREDPPVLLTVTLVRPNVALTTRTRWAGSGAPGLAIKALEIEDRLRSVIDSISIDTVLSRMHEAAKPAGLLDAECDLMVSLPRPQSYLMVLWDASRYPDPRMRSYSSRNAPGSATGGFSVTVQTRRGRTDSMTFLMPYAVTVSGPEEDPGEKDKLLLDILAVVFNRSVP